MWLGGLVIKFADDTKLVDRIYINFLISNFISIFHSHIAINLEDIDKTYANKD